MFQVHKIIAKQTESLFMHLISQSTKQLCSWQSNKVPNKLLKYWLIVWVRINTIINYFVF